MDYTIRKGNPDDVPAAYRLIEELAEYEKAGHEVENSPEQMLEDAFGKKSFFEFFVAEHQKQVVGMALYYINYSTWKGKCIYLDDLVVSEKHRRKGIGKLLFDALITKARDMQVKRLIWQVLTWNEPAIEFYKKINAKFDREWYTCRLTEEDIKHYKQSISKSPNYDQRSKTN